MSHSVCDVSSYRRKYHWTVTQDTNKIKDVIIIIYIKGTNIFVKDVPNKMSK